MVSIIANNGDTSYGVQNLVADTYDDITKINTLFLNMGSTVFVIETSQYYMLNGEKSWSAVNLNAGGDPAAPTKIIYEGGVVY